MTNKEHRCTGCGVEIQTTSKETLGYTPESALERDPLLCQRCFRIRHYNEVSQAAPDQEDFLRVLGGIGSTQSLVVHIVDLFDFEGSLIGGLHRFVGSNPVLLVVNKIDLLPKAINVNRIVNWVRKQAKEQGLKTVEVVLCSAKRNIGFDRVVEAIAEHRGNRDVYVVGATNVGKSTLINRLIKDYSDLDAELTVSPYPGTTLDLVKIPLDDGRCIIDTPGVVYRSRLTELVRKQDLQSLLPDKPIKPAVYQLNERQTLFFGGFARLDFEQGERQSFTCYVSNAIRIHRTKMDNADELYETHKGVMLSPPSLEQLAEMPPMTKHAIRIRKGTKADILISGLGWIAVNSDVGASVVIHAPKGIKVVQRDALI